jgi:hypothetical protein
MYIYSINKWDSEWEQNMNVILQHSNKFSQVELNNMFCVCDVDLDYTGEIEDYLINKYGFVKPDITNHTILK